MRAFDNVETRKGYSDLYQFGAAYSPETFRNPVISRSRPGNYLMYWMGSLAHRPQGTRKAWMQPSRWIGARQM